jgi:hypothetical protein
MDVRADALAAGSVRELLGSVKTSAFVGTYLVRLFTMRTSGPFRRTGRITFG